MMKIEILVVYILVFLFPEAFCVTSVNNRPIIGIVTEELSGNSLPTGKSFIMAHYVKYIEAGGARVVPIQIYRSKEYYQDILSKINGVLLPGGDDLLKSEGFGRTGKLIFDLAVEMNEKGDYFPLWGTCLGFELLNYAAAKKLWMKSCQADDWPTNIQLISGYNGSRLFFNLPNEIKSAMQRENVTIHFHHWCLTPLNFSLSGLDKFYKVLALNQDSEGETFVSIIEAYKYPFYGVTFHPEKILFDWKHQNISLPHSSGAVEVSQFFSRFFIDEARKNFHHFPSKSQEDEELIYNFNPQIGDEDLSAQMYVFQ